MISQQFRVLNYLSFKHASGDLAAAQPGVAKPLLTIHNRPLASARAWRPAPCPGHASCVRSSDWQLSVAAVAAPLLASSGRGDPQSAEAGPSGPPATARSPISENAPLSWWHVLCSALSSAGRFVALVLVVASLVLASPGAALAKGSGGRGGGRGFGSHSSGHSSSRSYSGGSSSRRSSSASGSSSSSSSSHSYSGSSSSSSRGTHSAASSAGGATALGSGGGGGGHSTTSTHITTVYGGGYYAPSPYYYPSAVPSNPSYYEPSSGGGAGGEDSAGNASSSPTATRSAAAAADFQQQQAADEERRRQQQEQEDNFSDVLVLFMLMVLVVNSFGVNSSTKTAGGDSEAGYSSNKGLRKVSRRGGVLAREAPAVALCRVQVAVLASAREELQAALAELVDEVDTSEQRGLHTLLTETALLLLRHREAFAYGAVQEVAAAGEAAAEAAFDLMSLAERSRFKEETLQNVQGRKRRASGSGSSSAAAGRGSGGGSGSRPEEDELVVVTVLLAAWPPATSEDAEDAVSPLLGVKRTAEGTSSSSSSSNNSSQGGFNGLLSAFGTKEERESGNEVEVEKDGWVPAERLDGAAGLGRALLALSGVRSGQVLAVEVLWTPEQPGDTFSRTDLLEDYPHLAPL